MCVCFRDFLFPSGPTLNVFGRLVTDSSPLAFDCSPISFPNVFNIVIVSVRLNFLRVIHDLLSANVENYITNLVSRFSFYFYFFFYSPFLCDSRCGFYVSEKIPISKLIVRADAVITNSLSLLVCDQRGEY